MRSMGSHVAWGTIRGKAEQLPETEAGACLYGGQEEYECQTDGAKENYTYGGEFGWY